MIAWTLKYLAGFTLGFHYAVMLATLCIMGAILRVIIPFLITTWKLSHLPGPPCHRLISGHGDFFREVLGSSGRYGIMFDVWLDWAKEYGPLFHYRHYHKHVIPIVFGEDTVKVLHDIGNTRFIFKDSLKFYMGHRILGENGMLLTPYNDAWRIKKTILRKFLNMRTVAAYEKRISHVIDRSLTNLTDGHLSSIATISSIDGKPRVIDVHDVLKLVQKISTDIMGLCLFNKDFGCSSNLDTDCSDLADISSQVANECFKMIADPSRKLPLRKTAIKRKTCENIFKMRKIARNIIEKGSPLTNEFVQYFDDIDDIIDDVNSLLFAGQDTTSNTITYTLANIGHRKEINKWLREELVSVAQNAPWTAINELPRLDAVMKEIMRLYPSAPMTLRTLHKDHSIAGYLVPEGSTVWVSPYTAARDPGYWEQPTTFNPQRFIDIKDVPRFRYFPFMTGPHECSGKHFAMIKLKMVVFNVLKRYDIEMINTCVPAPQMSITMHPGKAIHLRFTEIV